MTISTLSTLTLLLSFFTCTVFGSPIHSKRQSLATVYTQCKVAGKVAITFDDGPYLYLKNISDTLSASGAKGTFFVNGNNFDCIYDPSNIDAIQYAYKAGHQIASHTWSHGDLTTFTNEQIDDGMFRVDEALWRILGVKPGFMRPPYGSYDDHVRTVAATRGQVLALWDQDTGDADGATVDQQKATYSDAVNAHVTNMLVLNHETKETTATDLIPYAVNLLQNAGYRLVTLAECLGNVVPAYTQIGTAQTYDPTTWTCAGTPAPGAGCVGLQCKSGSVDVQPAPSSAPPSSPSSSSPPAASSLPSSPSSSSPPAASSQPSSPSSSSPPAASSQPSSPSSSSPPAASSQPSSPSSSSPPAASSSPPSPPATQGQPIHPKADPSKCLTASTNSNNSPVTIQPCSSPLSASQSWSVSSTGTIQIYGDKCLDVTSGSGTNGNKMQIYTCTSGNGNQQWTLTGGMIEWKGHTSCLDNTGGVLTAGNPTQLWTCGSTNVNQQWVIGAASSTPPPSTPPPSSPAQGKLIKPSASSSSCLTVQSNTNNAAVTIQPCVANSASQLWTPTSSGTLTIFSGTKCLDVPSGSTTNGVKLQVYDCTQGNTNQLFGVGASSGAITWTGKSECVDLTDGSVAAGSKVQMWSCSNGNKNQVWTLV